jgi:sugar phosphate isomerase/epimerase
MGSILSADHIAIQGWSLRGVPDYERIAGILRSTGCHRLELSPAQVDPTRTGTESGAVARCRELGIDPVGFGVQGFTPDSEESARRVFSFARDNGFPVVVADFGSEALPMVEALCAETGVRVAIRNRGRKHRLGAPAALKELLASAGDSVGLCLDTGWMLDSGEDPVWVAGEFSSRLMAVYVTDFVFDRAGRPCETLPGEGNLDVGGLISVLSATGYAGNLAIAYGGDVRNPGESLKSCVAGLTAALEDAAAGS